jgi:hypothetical protein
LIKTIISLYIRKWRGILHGDDGKDIEGDANELL